MAGHARSIGGLTMQFSRVSFVPVSIGGDDVTGALRKLDLNFGDLGQSLGNAAGMNVGTVEGSVAAGNDDRLTRDIWRNKILNASFDVWQRGPGPFTNGYTADRWLTTSAGNTCVVDRFPLVAGASSSRNAVRCSVASVPGDGSFSALQQRIEDVVTFAGSTVTVSFLASASLDGKRIGVNLEQNMGPGGSAVVQLPGQSIALSGSLRRYTLHFDLPSLSGRLIGASGSDFLELIFWLDAGPSFAMRSGSIGQQSATVYISDVEVKPGTVDTVFERRDRAAELALCQRYYEKSYNLETKPGAIEWQGRVCIDSNGISHGTTIIMKEGFSVRKRKSPVITGYSAVDGAVNQAAQSDSSNTGLGIRVVGESGFEWFVNNAPGAGGAYFHWTADAEL